MSVAVLAYDHGCRVFITVGELGYCLSMICVVIMWLLRKCWIQLSLMIYFHFISSEIACCVHLLYLSTPKHYGFLVLNRQWEVLNTCNISDNPSSGDTPESVVL